MSTGLLVVYEGWPDKRVAQPGDRLALKHGVYSARSIEEKAAEVHETLLAECPWLAEPRYLPSIDRYLKATAREQLAHAAIEAWDGTGRFPSRLLETATAAARLAWMMGDELGLTPAGHAKLKTLTAASVGAEVGLAELIAQGHTARLAAEARTATVPADSSGEPLDAVEAVSDSSDPGDGL